MARLMTARYNGRCQTCGGRILRGSEILFTRGRGSSHASCGAVGRGEDAFEDAERRRDEAEYQRGYHEVAQIQAFAPAGSALRDQMYAEMELAAYNRGEDY